MVEIAKAVSYESSVLIMDEPTSALTESEVSHLFEIIRDLRSRNIGIVYITHKMNELSKLPMSFRYSVTATTSAPTPAPT